MAQGGYRLSGCAGCFGNVVEVLARISRPANQIDSGTAVSSKQVRILVAGDSRKVEANTESESDKR